MIPMQKKNSTVPSSNSNSLVLGEEDVKSDGKSISIDHDDLNNVINDLNKFSDSGDFIDEIKLKTKCEKYEKAFQKILATIKNIDCENKENIELIFKIVTQSVEDYIYHPDKEKCNKMKNDIALKLLKPFVNDNEKLCKTIIDMTLKTITKTSFFRRFKKRAIKYFFLVLKIFSKAI